MFLIDIGKNFNKMLFISIWMGDCNFKSKQKWHRVLSLNDILITNFKLTFFSIDIGKNGKLKFIIKISFTNNTFSHFWSYSLPLALEWDIAASKVNKNAKGIGGKQYFDHKL